MTAWIIVGIVAFFGYVIWSIKRHRDPKLHAENEESIEALVPSFAGLSLGTPVDGNAVEVLENGVFFEILLKDIAAARRSVHLETFLWMEGTLGARVADALAERARAGVTVRLLLDASGSRRMGDDVAMRLVSSGCRLAKFHRWRLRNIGVLNERDHRKIVVIDGRVAFVGGHCIGDKWLGNAEDREHYADVSVRLRGPIVHSVQAAFSENWVGQTGELFMGEDVFPQLAHEGGITMHAAYVKPEGSAPAVKILHHSVLCCARKRIWIQNPYFLPEPAAIEALGEAVSRGADVRVLMPSTGGTDTPYVQHAGHRNFGKLLRCGVRLFEYPHTLLHQKVMTIDGTWCAIGSSNFDSRSFEINDEITLGFVDRDTAGRLDAIFERYARDAHEIRLEEWNRRGLGHRLLDHALYLLNEVL